MMNRFPALFFSLSLIGLILIYQSAKVLEPKPMPIASIDNSAIGEYVEITGYIESVEFGKNAVFIKLSDGYKNIEVVVFSELMKALGDRIKNDFSIGSVVSVRGTVSEYKGSLEIVPERVSDFKKLAK